MRHKRELSPLRRSPRRATLLALTMAAVAFAVAACGGSPGASVANLGSSTSTTSPPAATGGNASPQSGGGGAGPSGSSSTAAMGGITVQFSQCMRTHGFPNFPDPNASGQVQFAGINPGSASFQAAQQACAKYSGGGKQLTPAEQQRALANALKYSECMRSHGITDFPDPQTHAGGGISISLKVTKGESSDLDPNSPTFGAAQKACQSLAAGTPKVRSGSRTFGG